ncbi:VIR protein [Plasmodium vivax]|uniref:VIR protein n=2 Tax=Plasmodium vivax TaxID=5855 RepID=A0A1G4EDI8_PLAVI|nr:VIR protein [Plasmodium vivax]
MTTNDKDFTVDKIKQEYEFIKGSNFYKIYDEFNLECRNRRYADNGASCLNDNSDGSNNDYFEDNEDEIKKIGYIYLRYWLYDKIVKDNFDDSKIKELYQGWESRIYNKVKYKPTKPFIFYSLKKDEINKIRKIYAFSTILYENVKKFKTYHNNNSKYIDYFGEGLDEFISSINICASKVSSDDYCKEFDEFVNICKDNSSNAGISIYPVNEGYSPDDSNKYLLSAEEYKDKLLYIYLKDKKMLNFLKTSHFISTKNRTTIAATSVVGSAIGLSSIFYYLYKFTPFGGSLRRGKGKNIVNIDEQAHNSLLYTSDTEQIPFKNREYKVAYHTFNDT